jgi:polyisoprenoid-binding protein YceI
MTRSLLTAASLAAATLLPSAALAGGTTWTLDADHSQVGFRVRHMMVSWTQGRFQKFQGTVAYDDAQPELARFDITIDASSVDTNLAKRDEHLRSADFFDTAKHPTLTFKSRKVERAGEGKLKVAGDLTIRGVTRPVVLDVADIGPARNDPWGGTRRGATATTRISRKDFGLLWNGAVEGGGVLVGDEVLIQLEVELIKQQPQQTAKAQ